MVKKADKTADSYAELQLGVISVDEYDQAKFRCTGEYGTVKNPKTAETDLILDIQREHDRVYDMSDPLVWESRVCWVNMLVGSVGVGVNCMLG